MNAVQAKILTPKKSEGESIKNIKVDKFNECRIDVQEGQSVFV